MDDLAENSRLIGDLIRYGVVAEVDVDAGRCRVTLDDDLHTDWIPWFAPLAGDIIAWAPVSVGEQVLLLCPEGEIAAGIALPGVYSNQRPAPANTRGVLWRFPDTAEFSYDPQSQLLVAKLPAGGKLQLIAAGGVEITGDVKIAGKLTATGEITSDVDVKAAGISLKGHKHSGVAAGSAQSGGPV